MPRLAGGSSHSAYKRPLCFTPLCPPGKALTDDDLASRGFPPIKVAREKQALLYPCAPAMPSAMAFNVPLRTTFQEEVLRPLDLQMLDALSAAPIYMWAEHAAAFCNAYADAPAPPQSQCKAARDLLQHLCQVLRAAGEREKGQGRS